MEGTQGNMGHALLPESQNQPQEDGPQVQQSGSMSQAPTSRPRKPRTRKAPAAVEEPSGSNPNASSGRKRSRGDSLVKAEQPSKRLQGFSRVFNTEDPDNPGYLYNANPGMVSTGEPAPHGASFDPSPAMPMTLGSSFGSNHSLPNRNGHNFNTRSDGPAPLWSQGSQAIPGQNFIANGPPVYPSNPSAYPCHGGGQVYMNQQNQYRFYGAPSAPLMTPQHSSPGFSNGFHNGAEGHFQWPQDQMLNNPAQTINMLSRANEKLREHNEALQESVNQHQHAMTAIKEELAAKDAELEQTRQKLERAMRHIALLEQRPPPPKSTYQLVSDAGYHALGRAIQTSPTYNSPYPPGATANRSAQALDPAPGPNNGEYQGIDIGESRGANVNGPQDFNIGGFEGGNVDEFQSGNVGEFQGVSLNGFSGFDVNQAQYPDFDQQAPTFGMGMPMFDDNNAAQGLPIDLTQDNADDNLAQLINWDPSQPIDDDALTQALSDQNLGLAINMNQPQDNDIQQAQLQNADVNQSQHVSLDLEVPEPAPEPEPSPAPESPMGSLFDE